MWNGKSKEIFGQIDSQWSNRISPTERNVPKEAERVIALYRLEKEHGLSKLDYAWLAERGYIKIDCDLEGNFKALWQIVILESKEINDKLLAVGTSIKKKYKSEFDAIKEPYRRAVLETCKSQPKSNGRH